MNSRGSFFNSSSKQFVPCDVFGRNLPSTSCTEDKQTPSLAQCFLTHSNHTNLPDCQRDASTSTASSRDLAMLQKCADLQRFIRPLLELLHGLKSGRFDKGLTSFQQSVAIDRLQRILGILQKPIVSEKYLQNLLKIETMLKIWFPQYNVKTNQEKLTSKLSQHWYQSELHVPIKKRKMTWTDSNCSDAASEKHKHLKQEKHAICDTVTSQHAVCTRLSECSKQNAHKARIKKQLDSSCANGSLKNIPSSAKEDQVLHCWMSPPSPVTQDNSVSSSTTTEDSP